MEWKRVEGYQDKRPEEVDTTSSPSTVYLRRNISEITNRDAEGRETEGTHWQYDETQLSRQEFSIISQALTLENQRAMDETLAEILLNQLEV